MNVDVCPHCGNSLSVSNERGTYSLYLVSYIGSKSSDRYKNTPLVSHECFTLANAKVEMRREASDHIKTWGYDKCHASVYMGRTKAFEFWLSKKDDVRPLFLRR